MSKNKGLSTKVIIPIVSLAVVGLLVGVYFIGYNVGRDSFIDRAVLNYNDEYSDIIGIFQRSYYNEYNKYVSSYMVFREDNTCYYIEAIRNDLLTTVDFNDRSQQCTYTFDKNTGEGKFSINRVYKENGVVKDHITDYNFTFNGNVMIGAASYGRMQ